LACDTREAKRVWVALRRSKNPKLLALLFQFDRVLFQGGSLGEKTHHVLAKIANPVRMCELLELAVGEGTLDRKTVSRIQDAVLEKTTKTGTWTFLARQSRKA